MKTSLNLDEKLVRAAKKASEKSGATLGETISYWARLGYQTLSKRRKEKRKGFKAVDLGGETKLDLSSRRDWMDLLDK